MADSVGATDDAQALAQIDAESARARATAQRSDP